MKNKVITDKKALILFLIAILLVLSMPMSAFAEDEDQLKEEVLPNPGSYEGFYLRYNPEDIGYHVTENREKICILGNEEPLEIKIAKEGNDGSLLDHFIDVKVTHIDNDISDIFYKPEKTPDYEVFEEEGVLSFIFNKDCLECPYDSKRYEFLFMFDDGQAYDLVWATNKDDMLEYTEEGHVWIVPARDYTSLEEMGVFLPTLSNETKIDSESAPESESAQLIAEDASDEVSETRNILAPIVLVCVIIAAFAIFMVYRMKTKKG